MKTRYAIISALMLCAALPAGAQAFQEGFLLSNYRLGYRYNPALGNDSDMISIGQFGLNTRGNVGAAAFLYPRDGEVVTALHSSVSGSEFLGNLQELNYGLGNVNYNLASYGIARGGAYHTFEVNVRGQFGGTVPKTFFEVVKMGMDDGKDYDLSRFGGFGQLYAELAYGYSRRLGDIISVGARAKLLVGLNALSMKVTSFNMSSGSPELSSEVAMQVDMTSKSSAIQTDEFGNMDFSRRIARDKWRLPAGGGLAVDLGFVVTPLEGLDLSVSLLDLGAMVWYYGNAFNASGELEFTGLEGLTLDQMNKDGLLDIVKEKGEDALDTFVFTKRRDNVRVAMVPFQAHVGARYRMPFWQGLSVGMTGMFTEVQGLPYKEARLGVGVCPLDWLDLTANYGVGSYGTVFGVAGSVRFLRFRATFGLQNGFGGTIPYTNWALQANNKTLTFGLTYDL
ncbi:MAG: DUF5723 family protein [Bacteroidales bacterium]|nr:DUF5723 family protein [Bacteroidales bacterium]